MDLILINGNVHTMDLHNEIAEAAAVKDGKFIKVGGNSDVLSLKSDNTKVLDLKGRTVVPGFNDSHMHLLSFGYSLRMVDLKGCKSIEDMVYKVRSFISEKGLKKGTWVNGMGWNHDYFEGEKVFPTRYDLDKISTDHPVVLTRVCGHVSVVNSKALEVSGIDRDTLQAEGGHFDTDENGEPFGIFRENANNLIYDRIPNASIHEVKEMILDAADYANSKGLTSVQTDDFGHVPGNGFREVIKAYTELKESGKLNLRIYEQCLLPDILMLRDFLDDGYTTGYGDEMFRIGPLKLLSDGSLGARTAALCEPYADDPYTSGILVYTHEEMDELVLTADNAGMDSAIHSIGDKAMYMAFDSIENVQNVSTRKDARHSIVHCQITDDALINKFKDMDIIAHIQPIFLHYDLHIVEDRVGKHKAEKTYAFKTMLKKGIHIGLGTDCPVEDLDTMNSIYCAVTRMDLEGYPKGGWLPEENLTVKDAVSSYTMGSAYASFEEDIKGSITEGKLADMVVLDSDIFKISPEKIKDVQVDMTFLGGKLVYERKI